MIVGVGRSTQQYKATPKNDEALRLDVIRLAKKYGRYGYRKIAELLRIEGWRVNHKKVERIWREEGLQLPQAHQRLMRRPPGLARCAASPTTSYAIFWVDRDRGNSPG